MISMSDLPRTAPVPVGNTHRLGRQPRGAALPALRFIARQQGAALGPVRISGLALPVEHGTLDADLYLPARARSAADTRGSVLVLHGMSAGGNRDPRVVNLAQAVAAAGHAVIAPDYPEIRAATIDPATVDRFAATIRALADDDALAPAGRVAIVTASFSGAMALLAASRAEVADRVAAVCTVGAFGEIDSVIEFLMTAPQADPYGRLIVLRNYFARTMPDDDRVRHGLTLAIRDSAVGGSPTLPAYLEQQPAPVRHMLGQMLHDADWRRRWSQDLLPRIGAVRQALDVVSHVAGLRAPAFLLHGAADDVIPADQCRRLASALAQAGRPHRALVTPLIGHGDAALDLRSIREAARLFSGFSYFFGYAARARRGATAPGTGNRLRAPFRRNPPRDRASFAG